MNKPKTKTKIVGMPIKNSGLRPSTHVRHNVILAIFCFVGICVIGLGGSYTFLQVRSRIDTQRILDVYANLNLDDSYRGGAGYTETRTLFSGHSTNGQRYLAERSYNVGTTVDVTAATMRTKIEASGFTFYKEAYPGSAYIDYVFKSPRGEYLIMTVGSKLRNDAFQNADLTHQSTDAALKIDTNSAPSTIDLQLSLKE